jgi:hypothetical protein
MTHTCSWLYVITMVPCRFNDLGAGSSCKPAKATGARKTSKTSAKGPTYREIAMATQRSIISVLKTQFSLLQRQLCRNRTSASPTRRLHVQAPPHSSAFLRNEMNHRLINAVVHMG